MTLEAWVNPSSVSSGWRDVIYKGNDNYYLEATSASGGTPDGGGTFGGATATSSARRRSPRTRGRTSASRTTARRCACT